MPDQPITEAGCDLFLQGFDLGVDEFDDLTRVHVDQVVVVIALGVLIAGPAIAEFVALQYAGFFEQLDGAVDRGKRDARVQFDRALVEFLDIGMILSLAHDAGDGAALIGHAQTLGDAAGDDVGHDGPPPQRFSWSRDALKGADQRRQHRDGLSGWSFLGRTKLAKPTWQGAVAGRVEVIAGLARVGFQAGVVVAGGFVTWLWLLSVYPASTVGSFSFLTPILAIRLGHLVFGESLSLTLLGSAVLVSSGIILINRKAR